jgi:UDP-GlcNAc:undecaprenyl-phosphate/decaprenyl-phosphate GlcNAc-1-phosphate transferase
MELNYKLLLIWFFGCAITLVSFIDDMLNLSPKFRLLIQIIIGATIGITSIKIGYISNIFGWVIDLPQYFVQIFDWKIFLIPLFFTVIWYVFVFNALNWSDGIQGNTSGLSLISFFIIFLLWIKLYFSDDYEWGIKNAEFIMHITIILVGILIPFWYFDFKEKILMGDSGTMFLGFMLATIAIISGGKIATVLVVFGIYSVDALYVFTRRLLKKKNPLKWDFTHLHHRLLALGLSKNNVLVALYSLSFFFWLTALFLDTTGKIIVFGIIIIVVVFLNKILEKLKNIKHK